MNVWQLLFTTLELVTQQSQLFAFRSGRSTVLNIIHETCNGIYKALQPTYLKAPYKTGEWLHIACKFEVEWNFPHCIRAVDGKHVCIECPHDAGSAFHNYKNYHSMVLMAVSDVKYCFTMIDIGGYGRDNDASIFHKSELGQAFEKHQSKLNVPEAELVAGFLLPYVLVGDNIFALKTWLMKPYQGKRLSECQRIYNYRQS